MTIKEDTMTYDQYTKSLTDLRKEYADSIREAAVSIRDDYAFINHAEVEASEYRIRVQNLMADFHNND